jgi:uncharacterized protein YbjQ (UPF0145 family)
VSEEPLGPGVRITGTRPGGTWGSALTSDEFAAIRGVGFEPVGHVFGAAVYTAADGGGGCPREDGSFGSLVQAMYDARDTAMDRMSAECAGLGGHGVVGVRLSRGSFRLGGVEFTALGTAVRAPGTGPGPAPFTCDLSGQDFAKLVSAGWVPAGLALGVWIGSRHDDRATVRQARWGSGNAEVAGWTQLVSQTRQNARRQLERDVGRLGAEGVVIADMAIRVRQQDCPVLVGRHDHVVEATLIGTALARFSPAGPGLMGPGLAVMSLDPQRRRAARIRI